MGIVFKYFIRWFNSDYRWPWKIAGATAFGLVLTVAAGWRVRDELPSAALLLALSQILMYFVVAGLLLSRYDVVRRRVRTGEPVGPANRILFGSGIWSLILWLIVGLLVGFPLAVGVGLVM